METSIEELKELLKREYKKGYSDGVKDRTLSPPSYL